MPQQETKKQLQPFVSGADSPWPYRISILGISNIAALYPERRKRRNAGEAHSGSEEDDDEEANFKFSSSSRSLNKETSFSTGSPKREEKVDGSGRLRAYNEGRRRERMAKVQANKSVMEKYPFCGCKSTSF